MIYHNKVVVLIQELSSDVTGKKKGGSVSFLIQFLCGQVVALPIGWFFGIPLGICITEGILIAACFYRNVLQPQTIQNEINARQKDQKELLSLMKKL